MTITAARIKQDMVDVIDEQTGARPVVGSAEFILGELTPAQLALVRRFVVSFDPDRRF